MAFSLLRLARWLAWQVGGSDDVGPVRPASITVFSAADDDPVPS